VKLSRIAAVALLGIVTIFAAACGSSGTSTSAFVTYTDSTNGFSISVPDAWEPEEDASGVFFLSPSPCAEFYPFGNVVSASSEGYTSTQSYYVKVMEPYLGSLGDYDLVATENVTIDGIPAIKVTYTYSDSGYSFQEMACVLVDQQTAWVIVGSSEITCWNKHESTFNTMANSFRALE